MSEEPSCNSRSVSAVPLFGGIILSVANPTLCSPEECLREKIYKVDYAKTYILPSLAGYSR